MQLCSKLLNLSKTNRGGIRSRSSVCKSFCQMKADATVRKAAMIRDDSIVLAITADELVAKEAFYHALCYKRYTAKCYRKDHEKNLTEEEKALDEAFLEVSIFLENLTANPDIVKFSTITAIWKERLREKQFEKTYLQSYLKS